MLLLSLALTASPRAQSVTDSVRIDVRVYTYHVPAAGNFWACGAGVYGTWPDVIAQVANGPSRYEDYSIVAADDERLPPGLGQATTREDVGLIVPDGFYGVTGQESSATTPIGVYTAACQQIERGTRATLSGEPFGLNGLLYRFTGWYATFSMNDGTPIALFEWEQTEGLDVELDASFESEQSREIDATAPGNKRPVASYAWDFGDGTLGSGAIPTHTYTEPGDYDVTLTVTDDDGQQNDITQTVTVEPGGLLVYTQPVPTTAAVGDSVSVLVWVQNESDAPIYDVRVPGGLYLQDRYAEDLVFSRIVQQDVPTPGSNPQMRLFDVLAPGQLEQIDLRYKVDEDDALYSDPDDGSISRIPTTWVSRVLNVSGRTEPNNEGSPVPVRDRDDDCATTPCSNAFVVEPFTFDIEIRTLTTAGDTRQVRTGLVKGGTFSAFDAGRLSTDGIPLVCESGCIDVEVTVLDQDGDPAADEQVFIRDRFPDTARLTGTTGGDFFCQRRAEQTAPFVCSEPGLGLDLTTDADGKVRVFYAVPAVDEATSFEIEASVGVLNERDDERVTLTAEPAAVYEADHVVSPASDLYVSALSRVTGAASTVIIGEYCEGGVKWYRDEVLGTSRLAAYQRNAVVGRTNVLNAWTCTVATTIYGSTGPLGVAWV
ncbi:MAG: PKD domain-containing protein, partial [Bacteroidota bacterium]